MSYPEKKICLVIVNGFSVPILQLSNKKDDNLHLNELKAKCLSCNLSVTGSSMGLSSKTLGNSQTGHLTIGAGRICEVGLKMIDASIKSGDFEKRLNDLKSNFSERIHLVGLLSNGNVNSSVRHCYKLKRILSRILPDSKVFVHSISDGVDTGPCEFNNFAKKFDNIVSISGRYYSMDDKSNLDRTDLAYKMMTEGAVQEFDIQKHYKDAITDEFFKPTLIKDEKILPDDTIIFFNFESGKMIQLVEKFNQTHRRIYTMVEYKKELGISIFQHVRIKETLTEVLSKNYIPHTHLAEAERFKEVTYFFNGLSHELRYGEHDILIGNKTIKELEEKPVCSMRDIARKCVDILNRNTGFVILNIAGPNLVGYSADYIATEVSVTALDDQIEMIKKECDKNGYLMIITADHGNNKKMLDNNKPCKKNSNSKVPLLVLSDEYEFKKEIENKGLHDIAPTILWLYKLEIPSEMTGRVLLKKKEE